MEPEEASAVSREATDRQHFDRIAVGYTRKDEAASSRVARRHRLEMTMAAAPLPDQIDLLEVGCGAGYAVDYLGGRLRSYQGIDHSEQLVALASCRHGGPGRQFSVGRVQELDAQAAFDCVLMIGVLHHLEELELALARAVDALRPGGWLVVNEPQPTNPLIRTARRIRKKMDPSYADDQVEFSAAELREIFAATGLHEIATHPQGYLSTPFAEIPLPIPLLSKPLASATVHVDRWLGRRSAFPGLAWNCVGVGRRL